MILIRECHDLQITVTYFFDSFAPSASIRSCVVILLFADDIDEGKDLRAMTHGVTFNAVLCHELLWQVNTLHQVCVDGIGWETWP